MGRNMINDAKTRAQAKAVREEQLKQTTEIMQACTCCYPLRIARNGHGHDSDCPAVAIWYRYKDARRG